jgi:hypothetical protein
MPNPKYPEMDRLRIEAWERAEPIIKAMAKLGVDNAKKD